MDLRTGWDFDEEQQRVRAEVEIETKPAFIACSPTCSPLSQLQYLNANTPKYAELLRKCLIYLAFVMKLCKKQHEAGRWFVFEHPWTAWSWYLTIVETVAELPGVMIVEGHQCEFGQGSIDRWGEWGPVKKATGWMTNSKMVAEEVGVLCKGGHIHVPLVGARAKAREKYPVNLVKAIIRGIRNELKIGFGTHALEVGATIEEPETMEQITEEEFEIFTDNISGANLPAEKVRAGRREEMGYTRQLEVFERVPITECWEKTQRPPIPTG